MKDLKPPFEPGYSDWTYQELVDSMEVKTVLNVDSGEYQGDSFYLVKDGDRFGLLTFGWGSCSGCDALQGCYTVEDATTLRDEIYGQIHWDDDAAALLGYVDTKDWSLDWSWNDEAGRTFLKRVTDYLTRTVAGDPPAFGRDVEAGHWVVVDSDVMQVEDAGTDDRGDVVLTMTSGRVVTLDPQDEIKILRDEPSWTPSVGGGH